MEHNCGSRVGWFVAAHMKETSMKRMNPDGLFPKRLSQSVRALGCLTGT